MTTATKDFIEVSFWFVSLIVLSITAYYVAKAPIEAVKIGRDLNAEQNQFSAKRNLFLTLFAHRGTPVAYNFVNGLNQIDVVFYNVPPVLVAWQKYYDSVGQKGIINELEVRLQLRVELLSQMAIHLGYGRLTQMDIQKNYYPEKHDQEEIFQAQLNRAALKYFEKGAEIYGVMIESQTFSPKGETEGG